MAARIQSSLAHVVSHAAQPLPDWLGRARTLQGKAIRVRLRRVEEELGAIWSEYSRIAVSRLHPVPFCAAGPVAAPEDAARAAAFRHGARVSTAAGAILFALLAVLAMPDGVPKILVVPAALAAAIELSRLATAILRLATRATVTDPGSAQLVGRVALAAAGVLLTSVLIIASLRFLDGDSVMFAATSVTLAALEFALLTVGASLGLLSELEGWSVRLAADYETLSRERNSLVDQLGQLEVGPNPGHDASFEEVCHDQNAVRPDDSVVVPIDTIRTN